MNKKSNNLRGGKPMRMKLFRLLSFISLFMLVFVVCGMSDSVPMGFTLLLGLLFLGLTGLFGSLGGIFHS